MAMLGISRNPPRYLRLIAINVAVTLILLLALFAIDRVVGIYVFGNTTIKEQSRIAMVSDGVETWMAPNQTVSGEDERGNQTRIEINELGLRDHHRPYGSYGTRVFVAGDSFVFGQNSTDDENFTTLLEQELTAKYHAGANEIAVINGGMNGTSNAQALLGLLRVYDAIRPTHVVLVAYLGNDLRDIYFMTPEEAALLDRSPPPSKAVPMSGATTPRRSLRSLVHRYVIQNSHILGRLYNWGWQRSAASSWDLRDYTAGEFEFFRLQRSEAAQQAIVKESATLSAFSRLCRERGMNCSTLLLPSKAQVYEQLKLNEAFNGGEDKRQYALNFLKSPYSFDEPNRIYSSLLDGLNMKHTSLLEVFRRQRDRALYYQVDAHWTLEGRRLAAQHVASWLDLSEGVKPDAGASQEHPGK